MPPRRSQRSSASSSSSTQAAPQPKPWLEVAQDPSQPEAARLFAINLINDGVAYYNNVYIILTTYLTAAGNSYPRSKEYTAKTFADSVYSSLVAKKRPTLPHPS